MAGRMNMDKKFRKNPQRESPAPKGLKARNVIAQGRASLRATPWVSTRIIQALKGRNKMLAQASFPLFPSVEFVFIRVHQCSSVVKSSPE
jgi:hypothetical protein